MAGEIRDGAARGREAAEQSGEEDRVTEAEPPQQLPDRRVRPPDREAYDLAAAFDHKMVRQYEPDFLDKGGEHIVYRVPMAKDVVVKVDAHTLRGMQTRGAMHGLRPGEINLELFAALEEKLQKDRERFQRLRAAFGREHVPGLKQGLVRVPVTEKMLRALHGGRPPGEVSGVKESWAIVKVQRRAAEVGKDGTLSVTAGYAERDQADREDYVLATRAYVENDAAPSLTAAASFST